MGVAERIVTNADRLTATERRIAEVIAAEPQTIAFGTVALVARRAATSGPSVVRLAVKLGYAGFVDLQSDVQRDLARQLGPARERIRQQPPTDLLGRTAATEQHNVAQTLANVSPATLASVVERLADPRRAVWVLPGDATATIGTSLAMPLQQLRDGVTLAVGSSVASGRMLGGVRRGDTLVAIDIRRYERWLVELTRWAVGAGACLVAVTDGPLSPLAPAATETLYIAAQGVGPFDSMTGGVALANALVAGVAARMRDTATGRLDAVEAAWSETAALVAEDRGTTLPPPGTAGRIGKGGPAGSARQAPDDDRGQRHLIGGRPSLGGRAAPGEEALQLVEEATEPGER
jgi:DNA-binding MurR/RpiR family transcriptional regulator